MKTNLILFAIIAALTYAATLYFDSLRPAVTVQPEMPAQALEGENVPEFSFTAADGKIRHIQDFKG